MTMNPTPDHTRDEIISPLDGDQAGDPDAAGPGRGPPA